MQYPPTFFNIKSLVRVDAPFGMHAKRCANPHGRFLMNCCLVPRLIHRQNCTTSHPVPPLLRFALIYRFLDRSGDPARAVSLILTLYYWYNFLSLACGTMAYGYATLSSLTHLDCWHACRGVHSQGLPAGGAKLGFRGGS